MRCCVRAGLPLLALHACAHLVVHVEHFASESSQIELNLSSTQPSADSSRDGQHTRGVDERVLRTRLIRTMLDVCLSACLVPVRAECEWHAAAVLSHASERLVVGGGEGPTPA